MESILMELYLDDLLFKKYHFNLLEFLPFINVMRMTFEVILYKILIQHKHYSVLFINHKRFIIHKMLLMLNS